MENNGNCCKNEKGMRYKDSNGFFHTKKCIEKEIKSLRILESDTQDNTLKKRIKELEELIE